MKENDMKNQADRPEEKREEKNRSEEKREEKNRSEEKREEKNRSEEKREEKGRPKSDKDGEPHPLQQGEQTEKEKKEKQDKQEKQIRKKGGLRKAFFVEFIFTALFILFIILLQSVLSLVSFITDINRSEKHIDANIEAAKQERDTAFEGIDELYNAQVGLYSLLSAIDGEALYKLDDDMNYYEFTNYYVLDREGNVKKTSNPEKVDFHQGDLRYLYQWDPASEENREGYYNQAVIREGKDGVEYRLYSSLRNDISHRRDDIIVFEYNPEIIDRIQEETISFSSLLKNESVGYDGFAFAVDIHSGEFLYKPDAMTMKESRIEEKDLEILRMGLGVLTEMGGSYYLVHGLPFEDEDAVVCLTIPLREIMDTVLIGNLGVIITFFVISSIMLVYAVLLEEDYFRKKGRSGWKQILHSRYYYNADLGHKMMLFAVMGMIFIGLTTIYFQSLIVLSRRSQNTMTIASDSVSAINKKKEYTMALKEAGENIIVTSFLSVCGSILEDDKVDDVLLREIQTSSNIASVAVYDDTMQKLIAASNNYIIQDIEANKGTKVMQDVRRSLELNGIYLGEPFTVTDSRGHKVNLQYLGYKGTYVEAKNDYIIMCLYRTSYVEAIEDSAILKNVLSRIETGDGGRAWSVSKKDKTFTYFPKTSLIGKKASKYGVKKENLVNGYNGTIQLNGRRYFAAVKETDNNYVVITVPMTNIMSDRIPMCVAAVLASFLVFLILFLRMAVEKDVKIREYVYPGKKRTESAEDIVFRLIKRLFLAVALLVSVMNLFSDAFLDRENLIHYVFYGNWTRGLNIFSFTSCLVIVCQGAIVISLIIWILRSLEKLFSEKGSTICRLLASLMRYVGVVVIIFLSIASFGVNPTTLAASFGILTTVIGLGANSLLQDIFAGLFIIFEGDLKVNDDIALMEMRFQKEYRAKIVEIGIRTTKFRDYHNNIRIINNKNLVDITSRSKGSHRFFYNIRISPEIPAGLVTDVMDNALEYIMNTYPEYVMDVENRGVIIGSQDYVQYRFVVRTRERTKDKTDAMVRQEITAILEESAIPVLEWV